MICKDFFFLGTRKEKQEKAGSRDLSRDLWSLNPKWVTNDGYCAILQYLTPQHFYAVVVFQKVCLGRRLQILQICKYSDS